MGKALRFTLIIVLVLLMVSWLTTIAYGQTNDVAEQTGIHVEAAPPEAAPAVTFFGKAIGGVTAGDLFYIDATNSPQDFSISLYITNTDELIHYLRYFTLKVGVYVEDGNGQWEKITSQDSGVSPDTYITLHNSPVDFVLPGQAHYKVTIDSGCYYCLSTPSDGNNIEPLFYLVIEPV